MSSPPSTSNLVPSLRLRHLSDSYLISLLSLFDLASLLDRRDYNLNTIADWSEILSMGEQQRLSIIRAIIHQPDYCFLDESTSGLDMKNEELAYKVLMEYCPNTCFVSVGHRLTLMKYHQQLLTIEEGGKWRIRKILNGEVID